MRINQFIAQATGLSRRAADQAVSEGRVQLNGQPATLGATVGPNDTATLDGQTLAATTKPITILLNKPVGYVCSRDGQGSHTVYDLLPPEHHQLKPVGRLDKDSSGLLLLTNDGQLANQLTHPRYAKTKVYEVELTKSLTPADKATLAEGVRLEDGPSKLRITNLNGKTCAVTMAEGRNRQIRRSFAALGYTIPKLHRAHFGSYALPANLKPGEWTPVAQPPEA